MSSVEVDPSSSASLGQQQPPPLPPPPPPTRSTLLSTYWRDPEYLAHIPLTTSTALDYFSHSTFYDPSSTNEMLRMQNIANPQAVGALYSAGKTPREQEEELARFVGFEFVLVHAKQLRGGGSSSSSGSVKETGNAPIGPSSHLSTPPAPTTTTTTMMPGEGKHPAPAEETLFVIQKRKRESHIKTQVLETYYILNGNVHMAPDLNLVLTNRMITALSSLRDSLALVRATSLRPLLAAGGSTSSSSGKVKGGKVMLSAEEKDQDKVQEKEDKEKEKGSGDATTTSTTTTSIKTTQLTQKVGTTLGAQANAHSARWAAAAAARQQEQEEQEQEGAVDVDVVPSFVGEGGDGDVDMDMDMT